MSMFKCKMCGGDLEVNEQMSVCECQYCGSRQTLPKLGSEKKNNLYDRAGHFRRNNEYDKAMAVYEQILSEEPEDAESYWSLVLCRYGIEYVEDPMTHKRVPTVNRAQLSSIFSDEDYKSALKYADAEQRAVYEAEAREIEQIQKGILAISSQEEPFDVFICYKESDATGRRTPDSVLANDLYHQLTQEGFRVFFARITLEDKLGSAYEPYIFAALNSAKVMVVLGTKPEYFNAVWVKNEWSRYLALIRGGAKKILIPAYKDMDPYDLPEEFSHLQAQDMSKLGFMQDLIRGIKKLAGGKDGKEERNGAKTVANSGAEPLVKRAFMFLEDGEFEKADEFCEQALNLDPENAQAYVGKLMSELRVRKQEELGNCEEKLTEKNYFQKAVRFAKDSLRKELERCNQLILDRKYDEAGDFLADYGEKQFEEDVEVLDNAIRAYKEIGNWKDSELKLAEAVAKREELYEKVYTDAKKAMELGLNKDGNTKGKLAAMEEALVLLQKIKEYKDCKDLEERCNTECKKIKKKRRNKWMRCGVLLVGSLMVVCVVFLFARKMTNLYNEKVNQYNMAVSYMEEENYYQAMDMFEKLDGFKDSESKIHEIKEALSDLAEKYIEKRMYAEAKEIFGRMGVRNESYYKCEEALKAARDFWYTIKDGEVHIGGYINNRRSITIPKEIEGYPVTFIGDVAFRGCTELESITIPEGVTFIGNSAFSGCTGLTKITIPEGVTFIGNSAFSGCTGLTDITIPEGVTEIGDYVFRDCTGLKEITIPETVTSIGETPFSGCTGLTEIIIPEGVTEIGDYMFSDCTGLTEITIPEGVMEIGDYAFNGCTGLKSITIPKSVMKLGDYAFNGCTGLKSITIPEWVSEIRPYAFYGCASLEEITIPEYVTRIGPYAFYGCASLEEITISEYVTKIGPYAFYGCASLTEISIPGGVATIEDFAFNSCTGLTEVTIAEGVTAIGYNAFRGCTSLLKLTIPSSVKRMGADSIMDCNQNLTIVTPLDSYARLWMRMNHCEYQVISN